MKTNRMLLSIILIAFIQAGVFAQKQRWVGLETGMAMQTLQDEGHSMLPYHNSAPFFGISLNGETESAFSRLHISSAGTTLRPAIEREISYDLNMVERDVIYGEYAWLKKSTVNEFTIGYGGSFSVLYDFATFDHSANNQVSYELGLMLNPEVFVRYPVLDWLELTFQGSIPIAGYNIRPAALGLFPLRDFDVDLGGILSGGSLVTLNKVFNLHTRLAAELTVKEKELVIFYDYLGGVNRVMERKGFSFHKIGVQIPLLVSWK